MTAGVGDPPGPGSPFDLFEPSLALTLGVGLTVLGVAVLFVAGSPLRDAMDERRRLVVAGLLAAMAAGSGWFGSPGMRMLWTWIALLYAVVVPAGVALVGVRALVSPPTDGGGGS
jgi:cytochrome c oxidase subunit IV